MIDKKGKIRSIYDKTFLVPFGEYVPLGGLLKYFNIFNNSYRLIEGFSSGTGLKLIKNSDFPAFLPLVCYEALFSNEIDHLDFISLARTEFEINAVEYVNPFFFNKAKDQIIKSDVLSKVKSERLHRFSVIINILQIFVCIIILFYKIMN